jgi:signal transduction histidine kinase/ActR/RegA family two-component response regulator
VDEWDNDQLNDRELTAVREALERERLTSARLRRELEEIRRLSSDLIVREQAARTSAETANRTKDEFLATVSHEMRTPLNVVLGVVWRLRHRAMDKDELAHAIDVIDRNTSLQAQLVEDLLDVSRIITGKLKLHVLPLDMRTIVAEAVDALRPAADAKNIRIATAVGDESVRIEGDPLRLQQVVWNLLSNAVKFTPQGGSIAVNVDRAGQSVRLAVIDNGIGIAPDLVPFIFDRFRQGDSTSTRKHGGLGLGLSIVRHLVELHGGTVAAFSEGEDQGARFDVVLPVRGGEERVERRAPRDEATRVPSLAGVRVLITEDKTAARTRLQLSLERFGAQVIGVSTIETALDVLNHNPPDVLLVDVHMENQRIAPLLESAAALEAKSGRPLPMLAVSDYMRSEDRVQALLAGFKGYVSTTTDAQELAAIVATLSGTIRPGRSTSHPHASAS